MRESNAGHPRLTLQEIVYTREYVVHLFDNRQENDKTISLEKLITVLKEAIDIGVKERLHIMRERDNANTFLYDALTIEINTSRLKFSSIQGKGICRNLSR